MIIKPVDRLKGEIEVPGDKSISHRVVFIGGIARGETKGKNFLKADDCLRTVSALRDMGVDIEIKGNNISVYGRGLDGLKKPGGPLYLGNSGTTMRILPGILAGQEFEARLTGDESLSRRPMERIIEPLSKMGVSVRSAGPGNTPPLTVKGGSVRPLEYATGIASAQVKSSLLFAGLYANGTTSVTEPAHSRDHTERMLKFAGSKISIRGFTVSVEGRTELLAEKFFIPGDISSAAFIIAGALLLEGSDVTVRNVGLNPTRTGFLGVLERMGARVKIVNRKEAVEPYGDIEVKSSRLRAITVKKDEIPLMIDEIPVLAVLAARAEGETVIKGVSELKVKETDRVRSATENLMAAGADIKSDGEDLVIRGARKRFGKSGFRSFGDHRSAMSAAVTALYADGDCEIDRTDCVRTSFPGFFGLLKALEK